MIWDDEAIAELTWWRVVAGLPLDAVAKRMGLTRGSTIYGIKRHIEGVKYLGGTTHRKKVESVGCRPYKFWTEACLTEPYAARKRRLATERTTA